MKNKVAFITGAAKGIGFELANSFVKDGYKVALYDVDKEGIQLAANQLLVEGFDCLTFPYNVTDENELKKAINQTIKNYGRIDVLINNAGLQYISSIEDFPVEKFEQMVKVMLTAPFTLTKLVFPIMKKQQKGRIINMSSINGLVGFPGKAAYNSAKHGVIGLTKVAALEGAEHGITVNAICPGYMDTQLVRNQLEDLAKYRNVPLKRSLEDVIYPLVPQKRLIPVKEITDYALFLASDKATGVTGQSIVIDGGYTAQ